MRNLPDRHEYEREGKSVEQWREDYARVCIEEARAEGKSAQEWAEQLYDSLRRADEISDQMEARRKEVAPAVVIRGTGEDAVYDELMREYAIEGHREGMASWGLIASGRDAIPFALDMLRHLKADIREHGAGVLEGLGEQSSAVDEVLAALRTETDLQVIDTLVGALGAMRSREALPVLARMLRDPSTDGDTQWQVACSIGRIAGRRFDRKPDPVVAALDWLDTQDLE